jgi:(R,R)-butanediol dehydrogenase/meso-butanediol dehydrogenase/diacetyl reductase
MARQFGFTQFVDPAGDISEAFSALTGAAPAVQFECVGAPGLLQECMSRAPKRGLIMCIGVCDNPDTIMPLLGLTKELRFQWAVGYDKEDFEFTIDMMVAGRIDASTMVTDVVSLEEVPEIFEALRQPGSQCKVIIDLTR